MDEQITHRVPPEAPAKKPRRYKTTISINQDLLDRFNAMVALMEMEQKPFFSLMLDVMEKHIDGRLDEPPEGDELPKISPDNLEWIEAQALSPDESFNDILGRVLIMITKVSECGLDLSELRPEENAIIAISLEQLAWMRSREQSPDETNEHIVQRMITHIEALEDWSEWAEKKIETLMDAIKKHKAH